MVSVGMGYKNIYMVKHSHVLVVESHKGTHRTVDQDQFIISYEICAVMLVRKRRTSSEKSQHIHSSFFDGVRLRQKYLLTH